MNGDDTAPRPATPPAPEQALSQAAERLCDLGVRRIESYAWRDLDDPEAGGSECAILVVLIRVEREVAGLRDPPGHPAEPSVADLGLDGSVACMGEQRAGGAPQQEQRHQVLEHRAAP